MNVLSIQSTVAVGHVGNAAAVPALQRLGVGAWPVDTVTLSNHTDHATWRGAPADPARAGELLAGIAALGVLGTCDALLSGYLGAAAMGAVVLDALGRVRAANPKAVYACDPVMGNAAKGLYVRDDVPEFVRARLVPAADIVTPNAFELGLLTGRSIDRPDGALAAADALRAAGPDIIVCTSLAAGDGAIASLVVADGGAWTVTTPRVDAAANGAGDLFAALFLGHTLRGAGPDEALSKAVSAVYAVLIETARIGGRDLALVESLDKLAAPPETFPAERLR